MVETLRRQALDEQGPPYDWAKPGELMLTRPMRNALRLAHASDSGFFERALELCYESLANYGDLVVDIMLGFSHTWFSYGQKRYAVSVGCSDVLFALLSLAQYEHSRTATLVATYHNARDALEALRARLD